MVQRQISYIVPSQGAVGLKDESCDAGVGKDDTADLGTAVNTSEKPLVTVRLARAAVHALCQQVEVGGSRDDVRVALGAGVVVSPVTEDRNLRECLIIIICTYATTLILYSPTLAFAATVPEIVYVWLTSSLTP